MAAIGAGCGLLALGFLLRHRPSASPIVTPKGAAPVEIVNTQRAPHTERTVLEPSAAVTAHPTETGVGFDGLVARLIALSLRCQELLGMGHGADSAKLQPIRSEAEATWNALRNLPTFGEQALLRVARFVPVDVDTTAKIRRLIYLRLVREGLDHEWEKSVTTCERAAIDAFALGLLAAIGQCERVAGDLAALLIDKPYLGLVHEEPVLNLVATAAASGLPSGVAAKLLLTLWKNLKASGARSSAEILALALLFMEDTNPARQLAALEQLLTLQGGNYREVVLRHLLEHRDPTTTRRVASAAAVHLEPQAALQVLERLLPIDGHALTGPFMLLAGRDGDLLRQAYDHRLAQNSNAEFRAQLIVAAGASETALGVEMARLAFHSDPDLEVRGRALLALTAQAPNALGEQALTSALDDPVFSRSPRRLSWISSGLHNLANAGEFDAVDRVGRQLLARRELGHAAREKVSALLARAQREVK